MSKKLTLETKIRDAALSLSKANASYKGVTKQTTEQLDAANRKVDLTQKEVWRVSERVSEIQRRLLEHRAGVLSHSVRSMEKKMAPLDGSSADSSVSGYSTPNRSSQMSPTGSSVTSVTTASSKGRFDGAHFFAGHSDTIVPQVPRLPPSTSEIMALEEKLTAATEALETANVKQAGMTRELTLLRLEKEQMETSMSIGLQNAEDTIEALQREQQEWAQERAELEERRREVDTLERRLEVLEEQSGEATEIKTLLAQEREQRLALSAAKDKEIDDLNLMYETDRAAWDVERETLQLNGQGRAELDEHMNSLQALMGDHGIVVDARDASLPSLVSSLGSHLEDVHTQLDAHSRNQREWSQHKAQLEEDIQGHLNAQDTLARDLEDMRRAKEAADLEVRNLEIQVRVCLLPSPLHIYLAHVDCLYFIGIVAFTTGIQPASGRIHGRCGETCCHTAACLGRATLCRSSCK